jgi:hypothetical protein
MRSLDEVRLLSLPSSLLEVFVIFFGKLVCWVPCCGVLIRANYNYEYFNYNSDAATNTERKTTNARTIGRVEGEKDRRQTLEHVWSCGRREGQTPKVGARSFIKRSCDESATKAKHVLFRSTLNSTLKPAFAV